MAVNTSKWGRATARERYGAPKSPNMKPKDEHGPEAPDAKHGPDYENDASGWVIGANESGKPKR